MSFNLYKGKSRVEWYPKKASTAFANGDLVLLDSDGVVDKATSSTDNHLGVILRTVTSASSDYATAGARVPVLIPDNNTQFEVEVGTGTAAATNVGDYFDLTDADSVDVTSGTNRAVYCKGVDTNTNTVIVTINSLATNQPSAL